MGIVERVKNIIVTPAAEWTVIEREVTPPAQILVGYVLPLAVLGAIAQIIGERLAMATLDYQIEISLASTLIRAAAGVVVALAGCAIMALLIDALAPSFGGTRNQMQAFKLAGYAFTPALVAELARIIPFVGGLIGLIGLLYAIYLLFLGIPRLMKSPVDRAVPYTAVVVGGAIVGMWIITMILGLFLIAGTTLTGNPFRVV